MWGKWFRHITGKYVKKETKPNWPPAGRVIRSDRAMELKHFDWPEKDQLSMGKCTCGEGGGKLHWYAKVEFRFNDVEHCKRKLMALVHRIKKIVDRHQAGRETNGKLAELEDRLAALEGARYAEKDPGVEYIPEDWEFSGEWRED